MVGQLVDAGRELILDTNVAELSVIGRYGGAAKSAPWAHSEGPLQPEHFARGSNHDVIGKIARFAVEHGFHAVQAPAHLLEGSTDARFGIDRQACEDLRRALDMAGGAAVAIDYPLTLKYGSLRDPAQQRVLIAGLKTCLSTICGSASRVSALMPRRRGCGATSPRLSTSSS